MKLLMLGRVPGQWKGESWDGSAGKAGGRCEEAEMRQSALSCALYILLCSHSKAGGQSNKSVHKRKRSEVLEGKRRRRTDAERDQSVQQRLSNIQGKKKERVGGSTSKGEAADTPAVCWSQGRIKNNTEWMGKQL